MLEKGTCLIFASLFICRLSFVIVNEGNDPDVDDFKPPMKRPKVPKGIKIFQEQMLGRVLRMAQT